MLSLGTTWKSLIILVILTSSPWICNHFSFCVLSFQGLVQKCSVCSTALINVSFVVAKWHSTSCWVAVTSPFIFFHLGISLLAHLQLVLRLNYCLGKGYLGITVSGYLLISSCFLPASKLGGIVAGYRNLRLWSFSLRGYPTLWVLQVWGRRPSWWGFLHMRVGGEAVWEVEGTVSTSAIPMHNSRRHQPHRWQIRLFPASATLLYLPSLGTGGWYSHRFLHQTFHRAEGFTWTPLPSDFSRRTPGDAERWRWAWRHREWPACCHVPRTLLNPLTQNSWSEACLRCFFQKCALIMFRDLSVMTKLLGSNWNILLNREDAKLFFPKIKLNAWNRCSPFKKKKKRNAENCRHLACTWSRKSLS